MKIEQIIQDLADKVKNNQPISPIEWIEKALFVNVLADSLDNELAHFEADLNRKESDYIRQEIPAARAKKLARADIDYETYLKLKARINRIQGWILLAKKRAVIENNSF